MLNPLPLIPETQEPVSPVKIEVEMPPSEPGATGEPEQSEPAPVGEQEPLVLPLRILKESDLQPVEGSPPTEGSLPAEASPPVEMSPLVPPLVVSPPSDEEATPSLVRARILSITTVPEATRIRIKGITQAPGAPDRTPGLGNPQALMPRITGTQNQKSQFGPETQGSQP
jgi:hypothetical protein